MNDFQTYIDALSFLVTHTEILERLSWMIAAGILIGAIVLDRFKIWLWVAIFLVFIVLTQWQIQVVMEELGFTRYEITMPHVITILSGVLFVSGSGLGYFVREKFRLAYAKEPPDIVANSVLKKVNGGAIENSDVSNTRPLKY